MIAPRQSKQVTKAKIDELAKYSPTLAAIYRKIAKDKYAFVELDSRRVCSRRSASQDATDGKGGSVLVRIARQLYGRSRISFFVSRANGMYARQSATSCACSLLRERAWRWSCSRASLASCRERGARRTLANQLHAGGRSTARSRRSRASSRSSPFAAARERGLG